MYREYEPCFKELLQKDKSVAIRQKNLQYLAIEIYKVKMSISPKIINEIFRFIKNSVHSLRNGIQLEKPSIYTVHFRSESTVYLGAKILELIPENIKSSELADIFKSKIKKLGSINLSMLTMQDMHLLCWFCKLITSFWIPLLLYSKYS